MAIAFDSASTAKTGANPSWSHTCTGADRFLVVTLGANTSPSGITYNSVALTRAVTNSGAGVGPAEIWYLINPASGANTIQITGNGGGTAQSVSYTGVKQSGQPDAFASTSATLGSAGDINASLTVVANNCWAVGTSFDTTLLPNSGNIITTRRGGETNYAEGRAVDSNGAIPTGLQSVGFHYAGANTGEVVVISFAPVAPTTNSNFLMFF